LLAVGQDFPAQKKKTPYLGNLTIYFYFFIK